MGDGVDRGRDAFNRQAWRRAYEDLAGADHEEPLEIDDLERLASAAYLVGRSDESSNAWARAHQECSRIGEVARAARCAFWLAFALLNHGELARGGGWVDRAQRLLDDRKLAASSRATCATHRLCAACSQATSVPRSRGSARRRAWGSGSSILS